MLLKFIVAEDPLLGMLNSLCMQLKDIEFTESIGAGKSERV
jgi:hypothetical protein